MSNNEFFEFFGFKLCSPPDVINKLTYSDGVYKIKYAIGGAEVYYKYTGEIVEFLESYDDLEAFLLNIAASNGKCLSY